MTFDGKAFGEQLVSEVRGYVDRTLGPVVARLDAIERRFSELPTPVNGKDADPEVTAGVVFLRLKPEIDSIKAEVAAVPKMVEQAVAAIPVPENGKDGQNGSDGQSVTIDDVTPLIEETVAKHVASIAPPRDGKDGLDGKDADTDAVIAAVTERVVPQIEETLRKENDARLESGLKAFEASANETIVLSVPDHVQKAVAALPPAEPGKSVTIEDVAPLIQEEVAKAVSALPPAKDGADGKSVTVEEIAPLLLSEAAKEVAKLVAEFPVPVDGKSVTVDDVRPLIETEVAKRVAEIPVPKDGRDGVDVTDLVVDRAGELRAVLSNGSTKSLGVVVGRDGMDGKDAEPPVVPDIENIQDDDLNERIAKAVRLMAETPVTQIAAAAVQVQKDMAPAIHVHMADQTFNVAPTVENHVPVPEVHNHNAVNVEAPSAPFPVNVTVQQAPEPKRKEVITVLEHDARGRHRKILKEQVD